MNRTSRSLLVLLSICPLSCASALKLQITPSIDPEVPPDPALAERAQELPWERQYPVDVVNRDGREGLVVEKGEVSVKAGFESRYEMVGFIHVSGAKGSGEPLPPNEPLLAALASDEVIEALKQELRRAAVVLGANLVQVAAYTTEITGSRLGQKTTTHSVTGVAIIDRARPIPKP